MDGSIKKNIDKIDNHIHYMSLTPAFLDYHIQIQSHYVCIPYTSSYSKSKRKDI